MSEIWLTSDNHFFHANIIKYCNRPFSDEYEMNLEMERRWNSVVGKDDVLINVGDLTAGLGQRKDELVQVMSRLNGRKILIRGNHDHQKDSFYLENGFLKVMDHLFLDGVLFTHVPGKIDVDYPHKLALVTGELQENLKPVLTIHGHEHRTGTPEHPGHFNCASDRHDYTPFTLRSALEKSGLESHAETLYNDVMTFVNT